MDKAQRAKRRGHAERMKSRAKRVMRLWFGRLGVTTFDQRQVGLNASTHCRPCGCWMCQEDACEVPAPRERAFDYVEQD
jgi:hypothetical protein